MHRQIFKQPIDKQRGSILVSMLIIMMFLGTVLIALISFANSNITRARSRIYTLQALYAAESGADIAIASLNNIGDTYSGSGGVENVLINDTTYKATYLVEVITSGDQKIITSTGRLYRPATASNPTYTHTVEVTAERTSTTTASSVVSRNIIEFFSSVKDVSAVDIYVNGYIRMNKNVTNLIAENITVGGKNTGADNCSIGGTGNLVKPSVFTHAGQTKTNIFTAYNNCISPPGNTGNADFNVSVNQTNISAIQSTYIPFAHYMDASYQNSPSGCSDWTSGIFPRDIPSIGNTKKTHYPNNGIGISSSCGTSGNIQLATGQYNILDHVHLRANLCASSACNPTFYNPDTGSAGIKFVFIEGSVNFDSLHTASGSGPIVFVIYGPDPASKTSVCPLGGSFYLGNGGTTSAKDLYVLAQNGVCLDKTKYATRPAMGGVTGKNISVSTNSGTPFGLGFDPSFPTNQIPIDLAWKAMRYRRIL